MKTLCKHHGLKSIKIWNPRYHDKKVLIGVHHIKKSPEYIIRFTDRKEDGTLRYPGDRIIQSKVIRKHKKVSNGTIDCYAVPMDKLDKVTYKEHCEHEYY